jgi:hypothetical protein
MITDAGGLEQCQLLQDVPMGWVTYLPRIHPSSIQLSLCLGLPNNSFTKLDMETNKNGRWMHF